jgi:uncharacterized protein YjiS (DUF1127 family)
VARAYLRDMNSRPQIEPGRIEAILLDGIERLAIWAERARQRGALGRLNDRALKDIGRGRSDVAGEAAKPFWRD